MKGFDTDISSTYTSTPMARTCYKQMTMMWKGLEVVARGRKSSFQKIRVKYGR